MAFTISARTILELGKELISSDDVALYELIKNAIDAGSTLTKVHVQAILPASAVRREMEAFTRTKSVANSISNITKAFFPTAPKELVDDFLSRLTGHHENEQRYKKKLAAAFEEFNWIRVIDDGHGMSGDDIRKIYLRIGTRSRREANSMGSAYLGDKGVGRLSAMRLGDRLHLITTKEGESSWNELDVPWDMFSHDSDDDLDKIKLSPVVGKAKGDAKVHGTTVHISRLNADWSFDKFNEVVSGRIARLIDPFEQGWANKILEIRYNGVRSLVPSVPQSLLDYAHAECHVKFFFNKSDPNDLGVDGNGVPTIQGIVNYKLRNKSRIVRQRGAEIYSLAQVTLAKRGKRGHAATISLPISGQALQDLGEFSCDVYWFNRRIVEAISDLTDNQRGTREAIRQWAGGPMLYRRGFRILPYGDPDDDWLGLDRDAFGRSGFKLNRQQVIGRVTVSSSHAALSEQTNREGLVKSDAADALTTILTWLLHNELRDLINDADEEEQLSKRNAEASTMAFRHTQEQVEDALSALKNRISADDEQYIRRLETEVNALAGQCAALLSRLDQSVREAQKDREKFVHLAGIGLITEFIFHELDRSVSHTLTLITSARRDTREAALESLEAQLKSLQKRVSQFDEMTGEKRQTKVECDLGEVLDLVLAGHENQFARHNISVEIEGLDDAFKIKAVRGMLIQIFENIIANAAYWLKQQSRYADRFEPKLMIRFDRADRKLYFIDNGPGFDAERSEVIFQPFISSKPPGQGRGLGLYISRDMANYHKWTLEADSVVGRYHKGRLNGFVLTMSSAK